MMFKVMSLNEGGVSKFQEWLESPKDDPPIFLLNNEQYCDPILGEYFVDSNRRFSTSFELGKYLVDEVFTAVANPAEHRADAGMWAWISLALLSNLLVRTPKDFGRPLKIHHYKQICFG